MQRKRRRRGVGLRRGTERSARVRHRTAPRRSRGRRARQRGAVHLDPEAWADPACRRQLDPIWDWSKQKLLSTIEQSGISLPADYTFLPRSFDGFSYLFLMPLKEHYPRDYQRVLEWFPLAEAEIMRFEIHQRLRSQ